MEEFKEIVCLEIKIGRNWNQNNDIKERTKRAIVFSYQTSIGNRKKKVQIRFQKKDDVVRLFNCRNHVVGVELFGCKNAEMHEVVFRFRKMHFRINTIMLKQKRVNVMIRAGQRAMKY